MEQLKSIIFKQKKESKEYVSGHAHTRVRNIGNGCSACSLVPSGLEKKMESQISEAYVKRCYRRLRELGAPLEGWFCENVIDEENATFTCDLCGCTQVRYVHVMRHRDYMGSISVGCVCAGVMEGDLMAAKERERVARNRSQRRMKFIKNGWTPKNSGVFVKRYHGETYRIMRSRFHDEQYGVWWEGKWCWRCQGQPILSFGKAAAALYHIIDPPQEVRHA